MRYDAMGWIVMHAPRLFVRMPWSWQAWYLSENIRRKRIAQWEERFGRLGR